MKVKVDEIPDKLIISNDLGEKLRKKKYLYQFLPECFINLKDKKHIQYKGQKLKVNYLIDLTHSLILKYQFKKENKYTLNAVILKKRYGHLYNYYINFLMESNIIYLIMKHKKGVSSRVYSLDKSILKSTKRYKNTDKILLKKYKRRIFDTIEVESDDVAGLIEPEIKEKLITDLFDVTIDVERSIFFLDSLKENDSDLYSRNSYSVASIQKKHIFYHFDNYGRMHTNFTILKSFIRKNCLLIDGNATTEIDISNSQPLFLTKLIHDSQTNWVDKNEFRLFTELTTSGVYYQYLMDNLGLKGESERKEMKKMTYKVLFGRNGDRSKADNIFKGLFPTIHNFIKLYKKDQGNYKILAYDLQKMESDLIFNKIIKKIIATNPDIKIITVHDSIIISHKYKEIVEEIFNKELLSEFNF